MRKAISEFLSRSLAAAESGRFDFEIFFFFREQQRIPQNPHLHWASSLHQHMATMVKGNTHQVVR